MEEMKKPKQPNDLLRHEREKRGWSQSRVAEAIGADTSMISRWECGERKPEPLYREKLCSLFGKDAVELGFIEPKTREVAVMSTDTTLLSENSNVAEVFEDQRSNVYPSSIAEMRSSTEELRTTLVDRRIFLEETLVTASTVLAVDSPPDTHTEPWERFSRALQKPSTVDETLLRHLEILARASWQLIPDITGVVSRKLRDQNAEFLQDVTDLLEASHPTAVYRRLCSVGSEFAMIAASMSANLREFPQALGYYQASIDGAREAGNHVLEAVGLASSAIRLTHMGHADKALPLIQEARHLAMQSGTSTILTWLAAVEAEIQANLTQKDYHACLRALEDAESVPEHALPGEDPYMTTFGPSLLAGYKGVCYLRFDQPDKAYNVLREALTHLSVPSISRRCYLLTDLGRACIQKSEIVEACTYASQALALTAQAKSPALWQRLNEIREQLAPWKNVQAVGNFHEEFRQTLRFMRKVQSQRGG
jgi:transcriptional regulator with XRE-family HTH domain/tetratricopeptide (TPR) repeat protein